MTRPIVLDDDELAAALRVLRGEAMGWTARESGAARRAVAKLEAAQVAHRTEMGRGSRSGKTSCEQSDAPKEA